MLVFSGIIHILLTSMMSQKSYWQVRIFFPVAQAVTGIILTIVSGFYFESDPPVLSANRTEVLCVMPFFFFSLY